MSNLLLKLSLATILFGAFGLSTPSQAKTEDPYIWLEDLESEKSLDWVNKQNQKTEEMFAKKENHEFHKNYKDILKILQSDKKIIHPMVMNQQVYNFWRDKKNIKGIWRRQSIKDFEKKKSKWQSLIDIDQLSKLENKNWVFKGVVCLKPNPRYCLVGLSDGGKDASEYREFDLQEAKFVENGFFIPEGKTNISWKDKDSIYIARCDSKSSCTESGYGKVLKLLTRGQTLSEAKEIIKTQPKNMSIQAFGLVHGGESLQLIWEGIGFYTSKYYKLTTLDKVIPLQLPTSSRIRGYFKGKVLVYLLESEVLKGKRIRAGSLLSVNFDSKGYLDNFDIIFSPSFFGNDYSRKTFGNMVLTKDHIVISYVEDLEDKIEIVQIKEGKIERSMMPLPSGGGNLRIYAAAEDQNRFYFSAENINLPTSLFSYDISDGKTQKIQSLPNLYITKNIQIQKSFAKSKDGTLIPYFVVSDGSMKLESKNQVLIYAYGGFNLSSKLSYAPVLGKYWLNKKNIYVVANIRGGGEYGPGWHKAAIKDNKQKSYEDFIAVSEDLIRKKITEPSKIAIHGGSNGGLLVGAVSVQRPDLFGAVVSEVPLLDMMRYSKLLAGASWKSEYGDPENKKDWEVIKRYSPYHNLEKEKTYPEYLFYTSTKDDRVHPGHARKMVAKMDDLDIKDVYLYENTEGGHARTSDLKESAHRWALILGFIKKGLSK